MCETLHKSSNEFLEKVWTMETMFISHHGKKTLQPGKEAVEKLAAHIAELEEVLSFHIRCQTYLRI